MDVSNVIRDTSLAPGRPQSPRALTLTSWQGASVLAIALFFLDLTTKWVTAAVWSGAASGPITPARNHNLALGSVSLQDGVTTPVILVLVLATAFFLASAWATIRDIIPPLGFSLLLSGAAANAVDRATTGAVHDWLNLGVVIANLADIVLLAGLAILVVTFWRASDTL